MGTGNSVENKGKRAAVEVEKRGKGFSIEDENSGHSTVELLCVINKFGYLDVQRNITGLLLPLFDLLSGSCDKS